MATIRLTENLSVLLIPLNLILAVSVSLLVGFNIVLNVHAFQLARSQARRKLSAVSSMGAFSGLFIGCPTCAGGLFSVLLGFGTGYCSFNLGSFSNAVYFDEFTSTCIDLHSSRTQCQKQ